MRALITGARGFVGPHLRNLLENQGHTVHGFSLDEDNDVRDFEAVRHAVTSFQPDKIFHLAAVSWPGESLRNPRRVFEVNTLGTLNVLEAVRTTGAHAKILITGTSEEYGYEGRHGEAITENSVCMPTTPYGSSKLAATTAGQVYARRYGMHVVGTRAWNHTGWGRQAVNAESSFARRIVAVERGQSQFITHGDLSAVRNFTSVRDVIKAYTLVIDAEPGIYNVCSNNNVKIETVLTSLMALSRLDLDEVHLKEDPNLVHRDAAEWWPPPQWSKINDATGWEPGVSLTSMLSDVLSYWRSQ